MMRLCLVLVLFSLGTFAVADAPPSPWNESQWQRIRSLWMGHLPASPQDPTNGIYHHRRAIALGEALFNDRRLSRDGNVACVHCHQAQKHFSDGLQHALGLQAGSRNTPSLFNVGYQDWFFWDGRADSLWMQALGPLENPNEHGLSRVQVVKKILSDPGYRAEFAHLYGPIPSAEEMKDWPDIATPSGQIDQVIAWKLLDSRTRNTIDRLFSQTGKVIAAFVGTLKSSPTAFDRYIEHLEKGEPTRLDGAAERGLTLFIGEKAACLLCHSGPLLSNGEFHNTGTGIRNVDSGRSEVVEELRWNRFNCLGQYSDSSGEACDKLRYMNANRHEQFGSFKVPSLRNVANTAPYMHDGRYTKLVDAVKHYTLVSTTLEDNHLPAITLNDAEINDIAAFLNTLSEP